MKFIDSIQPPLAIWGELIIERGRAYFYDDKVKGKVVNPSKEILLMYKKRKKLQES